MNRRLFRIVICVFIAAQLLTLGCGGGCNSSGSQSHYSSGSGGTNSSTGSTTSNSSSSSSSSSSSTTCTAVGQGTGSTGLCTQPQDVSNNTGGQSGLSTTPAGNGGTSGITHTNWTAEPLAQEYMNWFLNQSQDPKLSLYVPGYAYYQGVLYAKGKTEIVGPVRIIGGVYSEGSSATKLQKGAMITTDTEYLEGGNGFSGLSQGKNKFHVSEWEELPNN